MAQIARQKQMAMYARNNSHDGVLTSAGYFSREEEEASEEVEIDDSELLDDDTEEEEEQVSAV
jgi:hypothetical protein